MVSSRFLRPVVAAVFVLVALGLSLSDRVPHLWSNASRGIVAGGRRFERVFAVDLLDRSDIPFAADEIGHVLLWGGGMVMLGLMLRGDYAADMIASVLFIGSVGLEVLQLLATHGRSMQVKDIAANGTGIALGLMVVAFVGLVLDHRDRPVIV